VARDPVRHLLGAGRLGERVVRRPQGGDEELDLDDLARGRLEEPRLLAGVVDEALLARAVNLPHGQTPAPEPVSVTVTEPRVAVAVGVLLQVLEMEQFQGDAGPAALGVDPGAVGRRTLPLARDLRAAVEPTLEDVVGQPLDLGPVQSCGLGPTDDATDRAQPNPEALGHGPVADPQSPLLAEDFPDLPHG